MLLCSNDVLTKSDLRTFQTEIQRIAKTWALFEGFPCLETKQKKSSTFKYLWNPRFTYLTQTVPTPPEKEANTCRYVRGVDMLVRSNFGTFGYFNSVSNIRLELVAKLYCRDRLECATSSDVTTAPQNPQCGGPERSRGPLPLRKSNCSTGPYQRRSFNPYPNAQVHNFTKYVAGSGRGGAGPTWSFLQGTRNVKLRHCLLVRD